MHLVADLKRAFWWGLARGLAAGTELIRRSPCPTTADQWRAVQLSYSHYGEDRIVLHLLRDKLAAGSKGIYIDVGAFDPTLFSNTLLLHQHGWNGINIEPNSDRIDEFKRQRAADVNLCAVASDRQRQVHFLHYPTAGTNRLIEVEEQDRKNIRGESPLRTDVLQAMPLMELIRPHLTSETMIDFLDVDCEGEDLKVLQGFDWGAWSPEVVAVEAYDDDGRQQIRTFMRERGYTFVAQCILTLIFSRKLAGPGCDLRMFA